MTDAQAGPLSDWIADILARWVPPEDYDVRMAAVVDGYLAGPDLKIADDLSNLDEVIALIRKGKSI
ncbi:hypothetical protein ACF082_23940 [Streptomyces lydicus]|uniref:hypothetical protein n=1 Tax=Streptomyces lydicus TaxID=47763 RepID=UPI002E32D291|nr:hypothetical protein [Streptomyces lydicus]